MNLCYLSVKINQNQIGTDQIRSDQKEAKVREKKGNGNLLGLTVFVALDHTAVQY